MAYSARLISYVKTQYRFSELNRIRHREIRRVYGMVSKRKLRLPPGILGQTSACALGPWQCPVFHPRNFNKTGPGDEATPPPPPPPPHPPAIPSVCPPEELPSSSTCQTSLKLRTPCKKCGINRVKLRDLLISKRMLSCKYQTVISKQHDNRKLRQALSRILKEICVHI